jgi:hypothetical protein
MMVRIKRLRVPLSTYVASKKSHSFSIEDSECAQLDHIILLLKLLYGITNLLISIILRSAGTRWRHVMEMT